MATSTRPKKKPTLKRAPPAPEQTTTERARRLRLPAYRPFRLKRIKYPEKLPSVWQLTRATVLTLWGHKKLFIGIAVVYAVLNVLLVRGLSNGLDVSTLKDQLSTGVDGLGQTVTGLLVFATLFGSQSGSSNPSAGVYQLFLTLIISLATIWALRQVASGQGARVKDAFYRGMNPLIPFILVLLVVGLQLVPMVLGAMFFTIVVTNGIAATSIEQIIAGVIFAAASLATLYMLCSSLFALYIVTLPDMTPRKALKSARQLVLYRRGQVFRRLLYLPVALLAVAAVIMVPVIIFAAPIAPWVFFALTMCGLIAAHAYMYTLYKALLA